MVLFLVGITQVQPIERDIYPTDLDRNISQQTASVLSDTFWRTIIETQLLYCPQSSLCSKKFKRNISYVTSDFVVPCCRHCSCDSLMCHDVRNCCPTLLMPNASFYDPVLTPTANTSTSILPTGGVSPVCMFPQVVHPFTANYSSKHSYLIISKCPKDWNDDIIRYQCEHEDFLAFATNIVNPPVVVGNMLNKTNYRNQACAICNGQLVTDLVKWDTSIACSQVLSEQNLESLKTQILVDNTCNMVFVPPSGILLRPCDWGIVSECNVTGDWREYDPEVEKSCHAYTSVYKKTYRNVFCAICNGIIKLPMACEFTLTNNEPVVLSFSAILDFSSNLLTTTRQVSDIDCNSNEMFDTYSVSALVVIFSFQNHSE